MPNYTFNTVAIIHTCYKEKFGIPRQPGLVNNLSTIEILSPYAQDEAFRELENFSHIWLVFVFNGLKNASWKPTIRPPRLGGNKRVGVFASRSMFRPNPIGLSVVELKSVKRKGGKILLEVIGADLLDKTPILDIKPYIAYVDAIEHTRTGYAKETPMPKLDIVFSERVTKQLDENALTWPKLKTLITEILQLDPRPAYLDKNKEKKHFSMKLYDFDVSWQIENKHINVVSIKGLD
ncbi:MAG: tRNA (N6-threonylcarbamoyladenosine(37)-N6)-methyltransferase TrmO [Woeseiaceae bacterium]